jgi:hypothetical protein
MPARVPVAEISPLRDARDQLTMVLSFFPRVDAKLSTVLAIDTPMLASLSAGIPSLHQLSVLLMLPFAIAAGLLVGSYYCLYRGGFPNLKGGHSSNVYFKDIAARNESKFAEDYQKQSSEARKLSDWICFPKSGGIRKSSPKNSAIFDLHSFAWRSLLSRGS